MFVVHVVKAFATVYWERCSVTCRVPDSRSPSIRSLVMLDQEPVAGEATDWTSMLGQTPVERHANPRELPQSSP